MRTFIAIDLEPPLKETLMGLVRSLRNTKAGVRWVDSSGMHLTLKFLGETAEGLVPEVSDAVGRAAARQGRFPLVLEGTGGFPAGGAPRVLWVGVRPQPALFSLQERMDEALEGLGFPREKRAFHPHFTLGRVKGPSFLREALAELKRHEGVVFGEMELRKVTLFESRLGPAGARYRAVSEHPLS